MSWRPRNARRPPKPKPAIKDGFPFASEGEAQRYGALKARAQYIEHEGNGSGLAVFRYRFSTTEPWQRESFKVASTKAPSKYNAQRVKIDGITFASKREAKRYVQLKHRQSAGEITSLELQVPFVISIAGKKITTYLADFRYQLTDGSGSVIVEDSKGMRTPVYILKKKLVEALYRVEIREV